MGGFALIEGALDGGRCVDLHPVVAVAVAIEGMQVFWRVGNVCAPGEQVVWPGQQLIAWAVAGEGAKLGDRHTRLTQQLGQADEVGPRLPAFLQ